MYLKYCEINFKIYILRKEKRELLFYKLILYILTMP